ncbi:MAG: porin family protein [Rhodobacteraceae bacterium]|nr:porin family protein [Paracoccaceae bacterium]
MTRYLVAAALAIAAGPALAQDGGWSFKITPYLFTPKSEIGVVTPRGPVSAELKFSDALESLEFAFMGAVEANKGKWSIVTDLMYTDLGASQSYAPGGLFGGVNISSKITALTAIGTYRVFDDGASSAELGGGLRAWWFESSTELTAGTLPAESFVIKDDWVDPILVLRARTDFSDKMFGSLYLDAGGFGIGSDQTYQAILGVGYELNENWTLLGGLRYIDVNRDETDFTQTGLSIGASYRF